MLTEPIDDDPSDEGHPVAIRAREPRSAKSSRPWPPDESVRKTSAVRAGFSEPDLAAACRIACLKRRRVAIEGKSEGLEAAIRPGGMEWMEVTVESSRPSSSRARRSRGSGVCFALTTKCARLSSTAFISAAQSPPTSIRTVTIAFGAAS